MAAHTAVRYSDEELREFKVLIDDKLAATRKEVQFLREQMLEINENSANQQSGDWTDESSSHTEMEMLNNMLARQQQFLRNLENATMRIQNKTYGVCTMTGQLISKERLRLVPHATKSVEAKNARPVPNTATHASANPAARLRIDEDSTTGDTTEETAELQKEFFGNE
jgi:RNA polymerase-binding transcription factor DksA